MNYTMVIADDEPLVLRSQELLIRKEFPEIELVGLAENGIELKQMLEQLKPDMAIVDVRMPGLTGIEVMELLQRRGCCTHFIINTAYSDFDYVKRALDIHADGYLLKPGKREESIETIRRLCRTVKEEKEQNLKQERMDTAMDLVGSVLGSEVLVSIFSEKCDEEGFAAFCDLYSIRFVRGCIVTYLPDKKMELQSKELNETLMAALHGLSNFLTTITSNGIVVLFFIPEELETERQENWCRELAALSAKCLKEKTGTDYCYGVGKVYSAFSDMKQSYQDSISDLRKFRNPDEDNQDKNFYISRTKQYVTSHFREDISLNGCAQTVGISPYYLSHIFKERTGQTFVEYLSMVRIEEAKLLSEKNEMTTKDIAEQCGYSNITYFCKVFKRLTGMTIGEYRSRCAARSQTSGAGDEHS
ncbi:MAG: helix-turn-helix domain-containing protein [Clostridiales bacterium]|nr:helix-turn-helix domain-containing protein [Clostridiales bacterium]